MSFERQGTRKLELEDTLDGFFDNKKLYLKSVIDHQNKARNAKMKMKHSLNSGTGFPGAMDSIDNINLDQVINRQEYWDVQAWFSVSEEILTVKTREFMSI